MNAKTVRRRSTYTPTAVRKALRLMALLTRATPRERAERRMRDAKRDYTEATQASIRGDKDAGERVDAALSELNQARSDLHRLVGDE